jgi:two-component system, OmpR family, alkaline phosphatase synthesis response regulator PhoP
LGERWLKTDINDVRKKRGTTMTATIKTSIRLQGEPNSTLAQFLDEDLVSISAARIRDEFRKLSRFLPIIVLVPKSAVHDMAVQDKPVPNKFAAGIKGTPDISPTPDATKSCSRNQSDADLFVFGEVTVNFSAMESHRRGQPVTLTCKQFKTLAYLIKNARRVITRDELLNEVWGYQCYPCTRTVDNHILQLRRKLEAEPARPKHFQTVRGTGYRFLP